MYAPHIAWVSSLFPSNLNMTPFMSFSISITSFLYSMDSSLLSPLNLARLISVHCP